MTRKEFWSKPPLERSRIVAERLKKRMENNHVTEEQVAKYTRMDAERLHQIMAGEIVMNVSDYCDIYFAIPHSDESHIPADQLPRHHLLLKLRKLSYLKDGWNGAGSKAIQERLIRRFQHHIRFVKDHHLRYWELSATNEGNLLMQCGDDSLLLTWEEIRLSKEGNDIRMPFIKENFAGIMELYNLHKTI